ncbi:hypothetical protein GJV80_06460 [Microlunatus sp. Gsoil 973]|nr:hypothetical protein GJV80_06460 [Microlunatus sp. Gsoil 973]
MVIRHKIAMPRDRVGDVLRFADGSHGRIYRDTVITGAQSADPAVLLVCFRLRWIRGAGHTAFRVESLLNTPLFAGFSGFRSKLWLANDENGRYRGVYQWDGTELAESYARRLWWVLALVSPPRSIRYIVLRGLRRDDVVDDPTLLAGIPGGESAWWRITERVPTSTGKIVL